MPLTRIKLSGITDDSITSIKIEDGTIVSADISDNVVLPGTDAITVPKGTTAQRGTGVSGKLRFNTSNSQFEGYNGSAWAAVGGGATGGGSDEVFFENEQTVTSDYTITTNKNAVSAGDITINSGVTVTVPTGSRWVVV
jgi:hypothetical protein